MLVKIVSFAISECWKGGFTSSIVKKCQLIVYTIYIVSKILVPSLIRIEILLDQESRLYYGTALERNMRKVSEIEVMRNIVPPPPSIIPRHAPEVYMIILTMYPLVDLHSGHVYMF